MIPWVGMAIMPEADFIAAALPLLSAGEVDVIEWSFDTIKSRSKEPRWLSLLLSEYSKKGRLLGHGVRYSLLKGDWGRNHEKWLNDLAINLKKYNYRHITEHFGFMTSNNFHKGTPLPVPFNKTTLTIGEDRLKRLQNVAQLPIGIENLAFAFSIKQVKEQGLFLKKLISSVNGFLILDLHNVWCQSVNFGINSIELIKSYPLSKVKEIHISGGSWSKFRSSKNKIRRDTHDEAVPKEVFNLLKEILPLCKNTEYVIFERLGNTIHSEKEKIQYRKDFKKIKLIVEQSCKNKLHPKERIKKIDVKHLLPESPIISKKLKNQQELIINILSKNKLPANAVPLLKKAKLLNKNNWDANVWNDYMVETAMELIKKWN